MESLLQTQLYINGEWRDAKDSGKFAVLNPANGEVFANVANCTLTDAAEAIEAAYDEFKSWKNKSGKERGEFLSKWGKIITENCDPVAKILTSENGKPLDQARGEVMYATSFLDFYAAEARRIYGEEVPLPIPNLRGKVVKEPIGVAGLIVPWNYPAAMMLRKIAPALAAGCTVVLKVPEDTPCTLLALAELAHQAGFPKGVINVLSCDRDNAAAIGKLFCDSKKVATISFTGSSQVGKLLMSQCSPYVKRVSLELGGLSPFIIFDSANLQQVVQALGMTKIGNAGQICLSAQNCLIQEEIYDQAVEQILGLFQSVKLGDGSVEGTIMGPLINKRGIDKVVRLVEDAKSKGAKVLCGGNAAPEIGELFYQPTILADVTDDMDITQQEVFGPVLVLRKFQEEAEAIKIANQSERGLGGYFFSQDLSQCHRVWESLEVGIVGCNTGMVVLPEMPFGGYKESGLGVESGKWGLEEFLTTKAINIALL